MISDRSSDSERRRALHVRSGEHGGQGFVDGRPHGPHPAHVEAATTW